MVAATGVGAGDLATAGFAGSKLGMTILWAVAVGAFFKFVLNEGLARWQLATGQTLLEGVAARLGRWVIWLFMPYFLFWSFVVGRAMMGATGAATQAIFPMFDDPAEGKFNFGIIMGVIGVALVRVGGFKLFEKIMSVCIAVMFFTVLVTAAMVGPNWSAFFSGLFVPRVPNIPGAMGWTVALIGGVGGTVTVLCYGYWIREAGRTNPNDLNTCRIDLGVGYLFTALFGLAMIVIASRVQADGKGATLIVALADQLGEQLGPTGRWMFLIGAWGALFSSLLGVWQAVPYIFADMVAILKRDDASLNTSQPVNTKGIAYRGFLAALAIAPMYSLKTDFSHIQKVYSIVGAWFMPLLAIVLLLLNTRGAWVGPRLRNKPLTVMLLLAILIFFAWIGYGNAIKALNAPS